MDDIQKVEKLLKKNNRVIKKTKIHGYTRGLFYS